MPEAQWSSVQPVDPTALACAVVISRTEHGTLHVGLLHRVNTGCAAVLHLGWLDFLDIRWAWPYLWVCPDVEPETQTSVAGHCRRIWARFQRDGRFPYALGDFSSTFGAGGGLVLVGGSQGLTCATFVMAVFRAAGVELVEGAGWPIRIEQDRTWLHAIARFTDPAHHALLEAQVEQGVARVHPQELFGACTLTPLPVTFERSKPAAEAVLRRLNPQPASEAEAVVGST